MRKVTSMQIVFKLKSIKRNYFSKWYKNEISFNPVQNYFAPMIIEKYVDVYPLEWIKLLTHFT